MLAAEYPTLAANLTAALDALKQVAPPSVAGMTKQPNVAAPISSCGGWTLEFNYAGGLTSLQDKGGTDWASEAKPIGQFLYESYTDADYNVFLKDFGSRIGDKGVWPEHTAGKYAAYNATTSDMGCGSECSHTHAVCRRL